MKRVLVVGNGPTLLAGIQDAIAGRAVVCSCTHAGFALPIVPGLSPNVLVVLPQIPDLERNLEFLVQYGGRITELKHIALISPNAASRQAAEDELTGFEELITHLNTGERSGAMPLALEADVLEALELPLQRP